jgi:hypothetical protein
MARDYTSAQFDASKYSEAQNRAYAVLAAVCGPEVAAAFARYYGKSVSPDQIVNTARQYGLWSTQTGMHGPQAQKALMDQLGIPVQFTPEINSAALQQAMVEGRTGAISTPNHYFFLQGYDPNTGRYDTGNTGSVYAAGGRYLTLDQMRQIGGGFNGQFISDPSTGGTPQPPQRSNPPSVGQPTGFPTGFGGPRPINGQPPGQQLRAGASYNGSGVSYEDKEALKQYIRYAAASRGIDPEVAVKVAMSEGLNTYVGDNGSSFGPYQLHYGNVAAGGNQVGGLGDTFTQQTGLDARDPATIQAQIDFTLDQAKRSGWGPWHGAARVGVGNYTGIGTYNGDPNQFGNYSAAQMAQASPGGFTPGQPTGFPSSMSSMSGGAATGLPNLSNLPMVQMGSVYSQAGQEYTYPSSPTITPPMTNGSGWLTP